MARLTIPDEQTYAEFTVVTSTTAFPVSFSLFAKADLTVLVDGVALDQSDFTIAGTLLEGGGYDGCTITLNDAVDDVTVRIERNVAPVRTSNFAPASSVPVQTVDLSLNRLTAIQQDHARRLTDAEAILASFADDVAAAESVAADLAAKVAAAEQAVTDAEAQVVLASDQVALAVAQVALASAQRVLAETAKTAAEAAVTAAEAQVALAAAQVALATDQVSLATAQVALASAQRVLAEAAAVATAADRVQTGIDAAAAAVSAGNVLEYGKNLWYPPSLDSTWSTAGQNLNTTTGALVASGAYTLGGYIPCVAGTQITFRYAGNLCYYSNNTGTFVSSSGAAVTDGQTKTVPATATYFRIAVTNAAAPAQQINLGSSLQAYDLPFTRVPTGRVQTASYKARSVDAAALWNPEPVARNLIEHLGRAGIPTKIAVYGDSITAGVGATGYSLTGATIAGSVGSIARVNTTCPNWCNLLRDYLVARFGGSRRIYPWNDPWVSMGSGVASAYQKTGIVGATVSAGDLFSTVFDGDDLTVRYVTGSTRGIFEIIVDGVTEATVDCYAASSSTASEVLTGLGAGAHTLRIRQTGTKNATSTGYTCAITYLIVTKSITVDNMGVSGATSGTIADIVTANVTTADHFSIIMAGTNDRVGGTPEVIKNNLYAMSETIRVAAPACRVILMSAQPGPPSGASSEFTNVSYVYYTPDVDMAVAQAANRIGTLHISHYNEWSNYIRATSVIPATTATMLANHALLMSDGVHPNDAGYNVMFRSILTRLGLAQILA